MAASAARSGPPVHLSWNEYKREDDAGRIFWCQPCGDGTAMCWRSQQGSNSEIAQNPPDDTFIRHGRSDNRRFTLGGDQTGGNRTPRSPDDYAPYPTTPPRQPAGRSGQPQTPRLAPIIPEAVRQVVIKDTRFVGIATEAGGCMWWGKVLLADGYLYACLGNHADGDSAGGPVGPVGGRASRYKSVSGRFYFDAAGPVFDVRSINGKPTTPKSMRLSRAN